MRGEKQGSRGGGYVGGFLQLFDWNAKSRKKLFSNTPDNPDQSKQKKRNNGNLPKTRFNLAMDDDEYLAAGSSFKGSSDYSYASSVTDEEGFGPRAPNVVARLMGLDSMPTSNLLEPSSTPFFDSQSLRESQYTRTRVECCEDNQNMHSGNLRHKLDAPIQKAQRAMINMPIEKFQTEILPPKSAKSIPVTQHKLLSPIKSPSFMSSKNAAHIMEAAAKIIELGPSQAAPNKTKMPSIGASSSVPLRVRELREKVEGPQEPSSRRLVESNAAKILKGQPMNKSCNRSPDFEDNQGKSISLALQAKVNVQKREGRKEPPSQVMVSQPFKSQASNQKSMQKKSATTSNSCSVLKQNNQKHNCPINKEEMNSKSLVSKSQGRRISCANSSSLGRHKNSSNYGGNLKVGSRKLSSGADDSKEVLYSSTSNIPRKRRSLAGNLGSDKNQVVDSMLADGTNDMPNQPDSISDTQFDWAEEGKRKGMDVVSFTFTAPLARQNNVRGLDYSGKRAMLGSDGIDSGKQLSSEVKCNVIGADDLSILLEQKLQELTFRAGSSHYRERSSPSRNSVTPFQDLAQTPIVAPNKSSSFKKKNQDAMMHIDLSHGKEGFSFTSAEGSRFLTKHKLQGACEVEKCRTDEMGTGKSLHYQHPSPISVLEPSVMTGSWNWSDTTDSFDIEGSKQGSSVQAFEVLGINSIRNVSLMELDTELSDSASSSSAKTFAKGKQVAVSVTDFVGSKWELEYVNEVLFNVELKLKDFAVGWACEIINPRLYDLLENRREVLGENLNENRLERKVLFDCVRECMDLRCRRYASGGLRMWAKGLSTLTRKERLAEDVCGEISGWKEMEDGTTDDVVGKDMSSRYGRWLDFETEAFELGVEIEGQLASSLINEVVIDILVR